MADEPTGNLDTASGDKIMQFIHNIYEKDDKTIIIVTHDARIAKIANRSLRIEDGLIKGEYTQESYTETGLPIDEEKYKKMVERMIDKKKKMEELFKEIMEMEEVVIDV